MVYEDESMVIQASRHLLKNDKLMNEKVENTDAKAVFLILVHTRSESPGRGL